MPLFVTPKILESRAEFYYQLGSQVQAGVTLHTAISHQLRRPVSRSFAEPLQNVLLLLEQGETLENALQGTVGWLPIFDISLIAAGEKTGRLDQCFQTLAQYYRTRAELARKVIGFSLYPAFVVHLAIFIFPPSALVQIFQGSLIAFLIPKIIAYAILWGCLIGFLVLTQREGGAIWSVIMERVLGAVPLLGRARRDLALARLAMALNALVSAGVTLIQCWGMAGKACGSPAIDAVIQRAIPVMEQGEQPSNCVTNHRIFPELFANLYHSGEYSGKLDETLERLHKYYEDEGFRRMRLFAFWAPMAVYGCVVAMVVYHVVTFYLGYFKQIQDVMQ